MQLGSARCSSRNTPWAQPRPRLESNTPINIQSNRSWHLSRMCVERCLFVYVGSIDVSTRNLVYPLVPAATVPLQRFPLCLPDMRPWARASSA
jgi:hypothetical protein